MPVLFIAVASFLVFLAIVVLLWIAATLESQSICRKDELAPTGPLALPSISEAFDPICSVLWEAPIRALEVVDSRGRAGIPVATLRPIYEGAAARFPEIYDGCSFAQWLRFLEQIGLISCNDYSVALTADGHAFLRFRFVSEAIVKN